MPDGNGHEDRTESALEEVLREVEEAERRDEERAIGGRAGDALSPNTGAQEQAEGD
ncbi:hypothetical protein ACWC0C_26295 [Streptomyces sp. NPDC001709]